VRQTGRPDPGTGTKKQTAPLGRQHAKTSIPTTVIAAAIKGIEPLGNILIFRAGFLSLACHNEKSEKKLPRHKQNPRFDKCFIHLAIDRRTRRGDIGRRPPSVHHEERNGNERDHCDDNREQFTHILIASAN
jgi:hypothetical protein